jgi:hypothetical protein
VAVVPDIAHASLRSQPLALAYRFLRDLDALLTEESASCRNQFRRIDLWSGRLEQDGLQRQARRIIKFASERLAQSVDNLIRIDSTAGADHVDQRVAVDQRTRKGADVRNLLFSSQYGNPEIDEANVAQRMLNRIDFVVARPDSIELRWIGREKSGGDFVSDAGMPVVAAVPDAEYIAAPGRQHAIRLAI